MAKNFQSVHSLTTVKQTNDNGFILFGEGDTVVNGSTVEKMSLIKTNSTGDSVWSQSIAGSGFFNNLELTNDGGFITCSNDSGIFLTKRTSGGGLEWQNHYSGGCRKMIQTFDGGFMVAGEINSWDSYLIKTDSLGVVQWDTSFSYYIEFNCLTQLTDSSIIVVGRNGNYSSLGIWKFKSDGALISLDSLTTPNSFESWNTRSLSDGGFIITGHFFENLERKFYGVKFNSQCQFQWDYKYDTPNIVGVFNNDCFDFLQSSINNNFYLVGGTEEITDCYTPTLISINQWATEVSAVSSNYSCKIFSSLDGTLQIQFNQPENYSLDIFDLNGKLISQSVGNNSEVNENFNLPSGVYLIKVSTKDFTASQLFPVVH